MYEIQISDETPQPSLCMCILQCLFPTLKSTLLFAKMCVKVFVAQNTMLTPSMFLNLNFSPI